MLYDLKFIVWGVGGRVGGLYETCHIWVCINSWVRRRYVRGGLCCIALCVRLRCAMVKREDG